MKAFFTSLVVSCALFACPAPLAAAPFALYGISRSDYTARDELSGTLATKQAAGPWVWAGFQAPALAGWDERAIYAYEYVLGPGNPEGNNVFSQPISSKNLITAHDEQGKVIGNLEFSGQGTIFADLDSAHAIVDPVGGAILYRVGGPGGLPGRIETALVTAATGIFDGPASIGQELELRISGYSVKDLIPGMPLQDNLFAAPVHVFFSEFAVVSVPEPSGLVLALGAAALGMVSRVTRRRDR
ncbi:MAG: hypothetical protein U0836_09725 [Pirellulales bacterium]